MDVPQTFTQRFGHPPEAVFDAILVACRSLDFDVESSDRELLRVRASVSANVMTWGEVIVIQVEEEGDGARLNAHVVTKRGVNLFARGRAAELIDQLVTKVAEKLRPVRQAPALPQLDPEVIARLRAAPAHSPPAKRQEEPGGLEAHQIVMLVALVALIVAIVAGVTVMGDAERERTQHPSVGAGSAHEPDAGATDAG